MWFSIAATEPTSSAAATPSSPAKAGHPVRCDLSILLRCLWNTGSPAGACHRAARSADPVAGDDSYPPISVIPIRPRPPLLAEGEAGIDVAVDAASGCARQAFGVGPVGAVARNAPTPTLDAVGVIDRGGRTGARHRGSSGRQ